MTFSRTFSRGLKLGSALVAFLIGCGSGGADFGKTGATGSGASETGPGASGTGGEPTTGSGAGGATKASTSSGAGGQGASGMCDTACNIDSDCVTVCGAAPGNNSYCCDTMTSTCYVSHQATCSSSLVTSSASSSGGSGT